MLRISAAGGDLIKAQFTRALNFAP